MRCYGCSRAFVILALAAWGDGLQSLATALGIVDPPNAIFFVALGFIVSSSCISRPPSRA